MTTQVLSNKTKKLLSSNNISETQIITLTNECKQNLKEINGKLEVCIKMFNTAILDISKSLGKCLPDDPTIPIYNNVITEFVSSSPVEPISLFIMNVYVDEQYRNSILNGNDDFFINNDHSKITKGDTKKVSTMFQFKAYWSSFDKEQKLYIKNATKLLVNISEAYIIEKDNGNETMKLMMNLEKKLKK